MLRLGTAQQKCISDITPIRTRQTWLHLIGVLDLFSRRIIGAQLLEGERIGRQLRTKGRDDTVAAQVILVCWPTPIVANGIWPVTDFVLRRNARLCGSFLTSEIAPKLRLLVSPLARDHNRWDRKPDGNSELRGASSLFTFCGTSDRASKGRQVHNPVHVTARPRYRERLGGPY